MNDEQNGAKFGISTVICTLILSRKFIAAWFIVYK